MDFQRYGLLFIYILSVINCLLLISVYGHQFDYDTESYINAWSFISSYNLDKWRPPVYPVFIGIIKTLFGMKHYLLVCSVVQHIVFLISIRYFYLLSRLVINNITICIWLTAFYALYPCIPTWNCFIITESFAIYGVVFMMYCALIGYQKASYIHIFYYILWMLFLVFLRPAQMYVVPVFLVGWLILFFKDNGNKKLARYGLLGVLISAGCLLSYSYLYKSKYGIFTPSGVGVINGYYIARNDGVIKPENTESKDFQAFIETSIDKYGVNFDKGTFVDLYDEAKDAISKFGLSSVSNLVNSSYKTNSKQFFKSWFQRFHYAAGEDLFSTHIHTYKIITDIIGIKLNFIYYLLTLYFILLLLWMIVNKTVPWSSSVIYMLGFCHLFLIIFACQNVWDRLILPCVPLYLIMIGQICSCFTISKKINVSFQ